MEIYARLIPYVRPHLRTLAWSWFLAVVIALMWGANFMAAWPLVKTLFEERSIQDEVATQIVAAEEKIELHQATIKVLDAEIEELDGESNGDVASGTLMRKTSERGRQSRKLTDATAQLSRLRWVEYRILPWLPHDPFNTFMLVLMGLLLATLIKCGCLYLQEAIVGEVVERTLQDVRRDCLSHALHLDYATTSSHGAAGLMSRFTFDAQRMQESLTLLSGRVVREPLKALVCIGIAFYVNWRLTLLSILVVPILGYLIHTIAASIKRASRRMMESMSRLYEQLEETLNGLKAVIAFNQEDLHKKAFADEYDEYIEKSIKVVRYNSVIRPTSEVFSTIAVVIAMSPCAYLVMKHETNIWGIKLASEPMDVASIAMLYGALAGLLDPATKLTKVYSLLRGCTAAIERIFQFLDTKSTMTPPAIPKSTPSFGKSIEFRDLSFQYTVPANAEDTLNPLVLDGLNLTVHAGECVAIVGENGCGKSTLLSFLPRFQQPTAGEILVDGVPITEVDAAELRDLVGLVSQDTILFNGTIADNIRYGRPHASDEEILAAAMAASVTQFTENLPNGFETNVGIQGRSLSGGQRQRISLARAMLRDPKLLLLDEATSAIDAQSEDAIHTALKSFVQGRTTLMVTHSMTPKMLEFVTRIVVIADGKVEVDGSHEKVLAVSPIYARLFTDRIRKAA